LEAFQLPPPRGLIQAPDIDLPWRRLCPWRRHRRHATRGGAGLARAAARQQPGLRRISAHPMRMRVQLWARRRVHPTRSVRGLV